MKSLIDMVYKRTDVRDPASCWIWEGGFSTNIARVNFKGTLYRADGVLYKERYGRVFTPNTRTGRTCGNRRCVNPEHVYTYTFADFPRFYEDNIEPIPESGCHLWTGKLEYNGYGRCTFEHDNWSTHRLSWVGHFGPVPDSLSVLHRCNTPCCIRPDHLYLGTPKENVQYMIDCGRSLTGTRNHAAKLSDNDIHEIRQIPKAIRAADVAQQYGVHASCIVSIRSRKTWKHL